MFLLSRLLRFLNESWRSRSRARLLYLTMTLAFLVYAHAAQPPWLLEHADFVSWAPVWMTHIGGTIPRFVVSFGLYLAGAQLWLAAGAGVRAQVRTPNGKM